MEVMRSKRTEEEITKNKELFRWAIKRLENNDYSIAKMNQLLIKKGASKEESKIVIDKLVNFSIINEDEMVENVIELANTKHYGYKKIISILTRKQISKERINKIVKDETRELAMATKAKESLIKRYKNQNTLNLKRNVFSGLIRYGFDENIASLCVLDISISPTKEINMLKLDYQKIFSSYSRKVQGKKLKEKIIKSLLSKGYQINDIKKLLMEERYEVD